MPIGIYKRIKPPWNKGKKLPPHTKRWKEKVSNKLKGRNFGYKFKKGIKQSEYIKRQWQDGKRKESGAKGKHWKVLKPRSQETIEKLRQNTLKRWENPEYRKQMSVKHLGIFKGKKSPLWQGGKSFEPYSVDWTETLKRSIRERDNYICQLCSQYGNTVHHIDYDKKNCNSDNLITLCGKCHTKTNNNRNYWKDYFEKLK